MEKPSCLREKGKKIKNSTSQNYSPFEIVERESQTFILIYVLKTKYLFSGYSEHSTTIFMALIQKKWGKKREKEK